MVACLLVMALYGAGYYYWVTRLLPARHATLTLTHSPLLIT